MVERLVTIDRRTHALPPVFTVFATQNPVEYEGTYPLPEAQKDRFMLKISMALPEYTELYELLDYVSGVIKELMDSEGGVVILLDEQRQEPFYPQTKLETPKTKKEGLKQLTPTTRRKNPIYFSKIIPIPNWFYWISNYPTE